MSEAQQPFRCADSARERGDPLAGTAPANRRWLLIEHPGPWPRHAVNGSGIEPAMLAALTRRAGATQTRILLVRRPGRLAHGVPRRWLLAGRDMATTGGEWRADADLAAAVHALATTPRQGRRADDPPIVLVCAHGVHDACCAIRGRPVAAALAEVWPAATWECSHLGGDRFAPNVALLPDGFCYGNLDPESAVRTVAAHLAGIVPATHLRGVSGLPPAVQAAVGAAYERCGPLGPADVSVRGLWEVASTGLHGPDVVVELDLGAGRRAQARIHAFRRPDAQLTCKAGRATPATEYHVLAFSRNWSETAADGAN